MTTNECSNFLKKVNDTMNKYSIDINDWNAFLKELKHEDKRIVVLNGLKNNTKYTDYTVELL